MKEQKGTSQTYPSLTDLVTLAKEGKVDDLLLGLARRQDEAERIEYEQAVEAFEYRTNNAKASWGECENAGVVKAGEPPSYEERLVNALLNLCTEQRIKALIAKESGQLPQGSVN